MSSKILMFYGPTDPLERDFSGELYRCQDAGARRQHRTHRCAHPTRYELIGLMCSNGVAQQMRQALCRLGRLVPLASIASAECWHRRSEIRLSRNARANPKTCPP